MAGTRPAAKNRARKESASSSGNIAFRLTFAAGWLAAEMDHSSRDGMGGGGGEPWASYEIW